MAPLSRLTPARQLLALLTSAALLTAGLSALPAAASPVAAVRANSAPDLAVDFDAQDATVRAGSRFTVSGTAQRLTEGRLPTLADGVGAQFTLQVTDAAGDVLATQDITAAPDGSFATQVPGSVTQEVGGQTLALRAVDASYDDLRAAQAGAEPFAVAAAATTLTLENSFVSAVGWVKPDEEYPSRIIVTNPTALPVTGITVTVDAPTGTSFTAASAGAGTATTTADQVTWTIPTLAAATGTTPTRAVLVISQQADTLTETPTLVWRDLSTTATMTVTGQPDQTATSHGPKVIPPGESYDTARYGDRPFPVVPVAYTDRDYNETNTGEELAAKINDPAVEGSTFNLFQEMSLGQLFPEGTVPSAGMATADFGYGPGFPFTKLDPAGTCTGTTYGDATGTPLDPAGTPLYPERIQNGVYQLPGDTDYYGQDKYGTAVAGAVAGVGALMDIDSACGNTGKLVYDAAAIADPEIDYSDYDTDKDGVVDFFMVVFAGCGGNGASQLSPAGCDLPNPNTGSPDAPYDNVWPHSSSLEYGYTDATTGQPGFVSDDQLKDLEGRPLWYTDATRSEMTPLDKGDALKVRVRVGPYNVNPETAIDKASVISHEYGHSLGLPDFYSLGSRDTYGDWNLMATDKSHNMDAFSRVEMGWVVPEVLDADRTVTGMTDSKQDTGTITWKTPTGTSYTLTDGQDGPVRNSQAFVAKLPGRQLIDPAKFDTGDTATKSQAWWSGSGNDFGCSPEAGRNLDLAIPGLADLPAGTPVRLELKSAFDIEWDYDYGFVLSSENGGTDWQSHESTSDYNTTTPATTNPNTNACQGKYGNGITGTSKSYADGTAQVDRLAGNYPDYTFIADSFDLSNLAGADRPVLRFSYATDPGLARPGWFIDDVKVIATVGGADKVLYSTDFETSGGPNDPLVFNGGCQGDLGSRCTKGWTYVNASSEAPADHAYYLEMRDRSGFDVDGKGQNDRTAIAFEPGLYVAYTDEAHGYGNVGTDNPPAQSPLDSQPEPGSDTPNLNDAAWTAAAGDSRFTDSGEGHTDNYTDPSNSEKDSRYAGVENPWRFRYNCLTFDVLSMSGQGVGPATADGDLTGSVRFDMNPGCGAFNYGAAESGGGGGNTPPVAAASASPNPVTAGLPTTLSAAGSTDADSQSTELDYSWNFGDGGSAKDAAGRTVEATYDEPGTYTATVTVTDPAGATDTAEVAVTVSPNSAPTARASNDRDVVFTGRPVRLSSAGSTDEETPNRLRYSWNFGDGGSSVDSTAANPTARWQRPGRYTVTLTVRDPQGARDTDRVTVSVRKRVPCQSASVRRTREWFVRRGDTAYGRSYCQTNGGGSLTLKFRGPRVDLAWGKAQGGGFGVLFVDGKRQGRIDFSGTSARPRFPSRMRFDGFGPGLHTARLAMRRGKGYVDHFIIFQPR